MWKIWNIVCSTSYYCSRRSAENKEIASFGFIPFRRRRNDFLQKFYLPRKKLALTCEQRYSCTITILCSIPIIAQNRNKTIERIRYDAMHRYMRKTIFPRMLHFFI